MAKPPTSVRSIRLPDETWVWLTKQAGDASTVNAVVAGLIAQYRSSSLPAPERQAEIKAAVMARQALQLPLSPEDDAKLRARQETHDAIVMSLRRPAVPYGSLLKKPKGSK